jgi:hypothetical protein
MLVGPILTFQFGLMTTLVCGGVAVPLAVILMVVSARQRKRAQQPVRNKELATQDSHVPDQRF